MGFRNARTRRLDASVDFDRWLTPLRSRRMGYLQRRTANPAEADDDRAVADGTPDLIRDVSPR